MKKVIVRGPALSQSGYGEHTRFVLRALRLQESELDIHVLPTGWGETGWLAVDDEERRWIDERVNAAIPHLQNKLPYDVSVQVTIPNEWQNMAAVNIGVTAGIETNKISPAWIEKSFLMDKIITISKHAKDGFVNTECGFKNQQTGEEGLVKCEKPVIVVGYPVKNFKKTKLSLDLDYDFNYLAVAQWGPRKNLHNIIKWFVEENHDQEVGLVVKTSLKNNSVVDREYINKMLQNSIPKIEDLKCKIYLLHGDMSEKEMHALYKHPKIKTLISLSHGEGFGLPLFEAAYSGLPIIAPGWSGQVDFLYAPSKTKTKKNKDKLKPFFAEVEYTLGPVPKEAVWPGVIEENTMWCFPVEASYKLRLRQVRTNYDKWAEKAKYLQKWVKKNFEWDKQHKMLSYEINEPDLATQVPVKDLPKISLITSVFDAEEHIDQLMEDTVRQTIFQEKCEWIILNANPSGKDYEEEIILKYAKKYPNIVYKRLEEDPGIYAVWNQAIKMSTGEFITNINCDDRRAPNALEIQARNLHVNQDVDLVYNDSFIVHEPNIQTENVPSDAQRYNFEKFSKEGMLRGNLPHNNPMWRKSLHDKNGFFNEEYKSASDWEFWLKCAFNDSQFMKLGNILGVYYFNPKGISTNFENFSWKQKEEQEIYAKYSELGK